VDFRPFRAWRYSSSRLDLSQAIAPPYDVISEKERETLYAQSPFNVVRLILGKEPDFYDSAARHWKDWAQQGVLVQDKIPALYLYEQTFKHPLDSRPIGRLAVVGVLNLESEGAVFRHEATFEAPRRDRLRLLEKTHTNLSPIFGLYRDSKSVLKKLFSSCRNTPPLFQAKDDQGTLHRGWALQKENEQKAIQEALGREKILIADGHHRFETALEYRRRMRQKSPDAPPGAPFDFVMMALVPFEDEGLVMLPTHRILRSPGPLSKEAFLEKLPPYFDLLPVPEKALFAELEKRPRKEKVFGGIFAPGKSFILRLKSPDRVRNFLPKGKPSIWYDVEANLLTHFVFDVLWGISDNAREGLIAYTRSAEEAAEKVYQGNAQVVFFLRSERIETIHKLAQAGEKMPQKTTYFYPKLASGLFFYHHEER